MLTCYIPSDWLCADFWYKLVWSWTQRDYVWFMSSDGLKEPCIRWCPDPPWEGAILRVEGRPIVNYRDTAVSYAKMAKPIEMPFGLWA